MNDPIKNMRRLLNSLKMGYSYWQPEYIHNQQQSLISLRNKQTTWIGTLEHDLRREIDQYIADIPEINQHITTTNL